MSFPGPDADDLREISRFLGALSDMDGEPVSIGTAPIDIYDGVTEGNPLFGRAVYSEEHNRWFFESSAVSFADDSADSAPGRFERAVPGATPSKDTA